MKLAFFVLHLGVTVSLLTFTVFEFRPNLLRYVNLGGIRYFAQKEQYLPDPVLVFTPRSSEELVVWDFRGDLYRADLGIETPVIPYRASFSEWGFRTNSSAPPFDVIVLGDSYIEFGETDADTLSERLKTRQ